MENYGIILSIPVAFFSSIIFAFIIKKITTKLPFLITPLLSVAFFVLVMGLLEFCCIISIGPIRLTKIIGYEYYNIHIIIFVLMIPALATIMQLQNRFIFLSKWYSIGSFCAFIGVCIVLQQFVVSEAIFGIESLSDKAVMVSQSEGSTGSVGRKKLSFNIKAEKFKDYPDWFVGKELPLTVAEAVKIADSEIIKYSAEKSLWHLSSIELKRFGSEDKWFYAISFDKKRNVDSNLPTNDYLIIPVLFNGEPIKGE